MITVSNGKFVFNGVRKERVIGRSSFKLANALTYTYTGQGASSGYGIGYADRWIEHNQKIFGEDVVLRVFLETAGWGECDDCMFGSKPRDEGFWNREKLRDGHRETEMHPVGKRVLEWLFRVSEETGVAFELIIDATLKHDDIPKGEIDHVIRQTGIRMGELNELYPRSLIIPSMRNEIFAHNESGHTLNDVNMWAVRWDRDEYWNGAAKIVDHGGQNYFEYDVGPEAGKYRAGMIHPDRGDGWERFPSPPQLEQLRRDARGMPVGFTESMYYVEPEDRDRANDWYRNPSGWTSNWPQYKRFLEHAIPKVDYFIIHDEKGAQCDPNWPRPETRVEAWAREYFGTGGGPDPPPPDPPDPPDPPRPPMPELKVIYNRNFVYIDRPEPIVRDVDEHGEDPFRARYFVSLKHDFEVVAIDSFFGHDRGDAYEVAITVHADEELDRLQKPRLFLWRRIDEDTAPNGAGSELEHLADDTTIRTLRIDVLFRVTGENELVDQGHPSYQKWRGVFDWNLMLVGRKV